MRTLTRPIDLTRSIPTRVPIVRQAVHVGLCALAGAAAGTGDPLLRTPGGDDADREAGVRWLASRLGPRIPASRMLITNGTQTALGLLLPHLVARADAATDAPVLLTEPLTYGVLDPLLRHLRMAAWPVPIDADGLDPDALTAACRVTHARVLYLNPTFHNPTTVTMSRPRREAIAAVARTHGIAIVEDDALGMVCPGAPPPFAALAPDVTWYVMGTTKGLAQGLRLAYIVAPDAHALEALRAPLGPLHSWSASALSLGLMAHWLAEGWADAIRLALIEENQWRAACADAAFARYAHASPAGCPHAWLPLPAAWTRDRFVAAARDRGVLVRPADLFAMGGAHAPEAVRLSLSSPADREDVVAALETLDRLLARAP